MKNKKTSSEKRIRNVFSRKNWVFMAIGDDGTECVGVIQRSILFAIGEEAIADALSVDFLVTQTKENSKIAVFAVKKESLPEPLMNLLLCGLGITERVSKQRDCVIFARKQSDAETCLNFALAVDTGDFWESKEALLN